VTKTKVLIVEDEAIVAADLANKLGQLGYQIIGSAASGEEAIVIAGEQRPDIVIMDIRLSGALDGIETAARMRGAYDLPVVYLTAHSDPDTLTRALGTEPFGYVLKPFVDRELKTQIEIGLYKHRTESALREKEERLRLAAEAAGFGTYDIDLVTGTVYWSEEAKQILGMLADGSINQAFGNRPEDIYPGECARIEAAIRRSVNQPDETTLSTEYSIARSDGESGWVLARGRALFSGEGESRRAVRAIGTIVDITAVKHANERLRRRQEELERLNRELEDINRGMVTLYAELDEKAKELRQADEMKTRFLSNISHELRTPLNSIFALSNLLLDHVDGELSSEQEKQVGFIRKAADSLLELVNDLLDLAKIRAGKIDVHPVEFEAANLFSALRGMLRSLLVNEAVKLVFEEPEDVPLLYSDEGEVSQILRNFISNALKFTERGEVRVSARHDEDRGMVTFTVSDTGVGIATQNHSRIFEEFTQLENPAQSQFKGTGLGLPLCRKLAELLGGKIELESELGVGSKFSVTLPVRYATEDQADDVEEPAAATARAK
jgi:PAS domain S-box-containing protein